VAEELVILNPWFFWTSMVRVPAVVALLTSLMIRTGTILVTLRASTTRVEDALTAE